MLFALFFYLLCVNLCYSEQICYIMKVEYFSVGDFMINNENCVLPSGLVTCFIGDRELRILDISTDRISLRLNEDIDDIASILVAFYVFSENRYEEIVINDFKLLNKENTEFYKIYRFEINDKNYSSNVKKILNNYSKYVTLKTFGSESEFSQEMVNYPSQEDYKFYSFFDDMKREWMKEINYEDYDDTVLSSVNYAVSLHNDNMYKKYLALGIDKFLDCYIDENYIGNHPIFKNKISRIYIGNEFCHNLFPNIDMLLKIMDKAVYEGIDVTLSFTYLRDCLINKTKADIDEIYSWCVKNNKNIEIVINDWGMLNLIEHKDDYITPVIGVLLNKRKKDPRIQYKNGFKNHNDLMAENSLNSESYSQFLKKLLIKRYEYESCGYKMNIAKGKHSIHIPYYVTNTSQFCPLYAMCTNMDRGNQKLVINCPKYCSDYAFAYPKHLKMAGIYNSLFSFDDTLLKEFYSLKDYVDNGIDRIVFNFM